MENYAKSLIRLFFLVILYITSLLVLGQEFRNYEKIDQHADRFPESVSKNIDSLSVYLTQPAMNNYEKIRAIFRWITQNIHYDVESYLNRDHKHRTPEQVIRQRKAVCDGYSNLLAELGKEAGLEVAVIYGYSKGYGYNTGDQFTGPANHAWNAVKINRRWYLLDVTWGAGYIDEQNNFVNKFQEYYFLTPPEKFIFDHFPENEKWQLLDHRISLSEFQKMPNLQPAFSDYGLALKSHQQNVIRTDNDIKVDFFAPDYVSVIGQVTNDQQNLPDYLVISQRKSGQYSVFAEFPDRGTYRLKIFVKPISQLGEYHFATEYKVEVDRGKQNAGFPSTFAAFYENNAYLFEPLWRTLKSGQDQNIKISIPCALEVVLKNNEQWHPLKKQGQLFEAQIPLQTGKATLYAKFSEGKQYIGIAEWVCK